MNRSRHLPTFREMPLGRGFRLLVLALAVVLGRAERLERPRAAPASVRDPGAVADGDIIKGAVIKIVVELYAGHPAVIARRELIARGLRGRGEHVELREPLHIAR